MNTLNRTLEARIWLDRREDAGVFFPVPMGRFAAWKTRLRVLAARMQMGPVSDAETWLDRHREDRF